MCALFTNTILAFPLIFELLGSNKLSKAKTSRVCHLVTYSGWVVSLYIRRQNFCWTAAKVKMESTCFKFISQSTAIILALLISSCYFQKRLALKGSLDYISWVCILQTSSCSEWNFLVTKLLIPVWLLDLYPVLTAQTDLVYRLFQWQTWTEYLMSLF